MSNDLYVRLLDQLLYVPWRKPKPTKAEMVEALVRAANEAGIRRHEINEAYDRLGI